MQKKSNNEDYGYIEDKKKSEALLKKLIRHVDAKNKKEAKACEKES